MNPREYPTFDQEELLFWTRLVGRSVGRSADRSVFRSAYQSADRSTDRTVGLSAGQKLLCIEVIHMTKKMEFTQGAPRYHTFPISSPSYLLLKVETYEMTIESYLPAQYMEYK